MMRFNRRSFIPYLLLAAIASTMLPAIAQTRIKIPPRIVPGLKKTAAAVKKPASLHIDNKNGVVLVRTEYGKLLYKGVVADEAVQIEVDNTARADQYRIKLHDAKDNSLWETVIDGSTMPTLRLNIPSLTGLTITLEPGDSEKRVSGTSVIQLDKNNVTAVADFTSEKHSVHTERDGEYFKTTASQDGEKGEEQKVEVPGLSAQYVPHTDPWDVTSPETLAKHKIFVLQIDNNDGQVQVHNQDGAQPFRKTLTDSNLSVEIDKPKGARIATITLRDSKKNKLWETKMGDDSAGEFSMTPTDSGGVLLVLIPRDGSQEKVSLASGASIVLGNDNAIHALEITKTDADSHTMTQRRERIGDKFHVTVLRDGKKVEEHDEGGDGS